MSPATKVLSLVDRGSTLSAAELETTRNPLYLMKRLACDTVAECHGQVLGKPRDRDDARRMLTLLRGKQHREHSGLCLWIRPEDKTTLQLDTTTLVMDDVSDEQLESYLDTNLWEGKAGAFGYQDGWDWLHIIEGSESNVIGLPMEKVRLLTS